MGFWHPSEILCFLYWVPMVSVALLLTHGYGRQLRFAREHIEPLRGSPASFARITHPHPLPRLLLRSLLPVRGFLALKTSKNQKQNLNYLINKSLHILK
jgi:hypothetical protein